jgi:hypothetical protein
VADSWFSLSTADQQEALEVAAASTGRPAHLLEKDIWVVWTLGAIYGSDLANKLICGFAYLQIQSGQNVVCLNT